MTAVAATTVAMATGCSDDDEPDEFDEGAVAAEATGSVDDGECDVPVTFDVADGWSIESISRDTAETARQGGSAPTCELAGHDAGWIGFIRVWTSDDDDVEQALEDFVDNVSGELTDSESRSLRVAGTDAFETSYMRIDALDERNPGRVFAVPYDDGVVLVGLSGFDAEEYEGALPAYVLARNTAELTG